MQPLLARRLVRSLSEQHPTDKAGAVDSLRATPLPSDDAIARAAPATPSVGGDGLSPGSETTRRASVGQRRKSFEAEDMMSKAEHARDSLRVQTCDEFAEARNACVATGDVAPAAATADTQLAASPPVTRFRKRRGSKTAEDFVMAQEQLRTLSGVDELTSTE